MALSPIKDVLDQPIGPLDHWISSSMMHHYGLLEGQNNLKRFLDQPICPLDNCMSSSSLLWLTTSGAKPHREGTYLKPRLDTT